jgi:hypothetical protein
MQPQGHVRSDPSSQKTPPSTVPPPSSGCLGFKSISGLHCSWGQSPHDPVILDTPPRHPRVCVTRLLGSSRSVSSWGPRSTITRVWGFPLHLCYLNLTVCAVKPGKGMEGTVLWG